MTPWALEHLACSPSRCRPPRRYVQRCTPGTVCCVDTRGQDNVTGQCHQDAAPAGSTTAPSCVHQHIPSISAVSWRHINTGLRCMGFRHTGAFARGLSPHGGFRHTGAFATRAFAAGAFAARASATRACGISPTQHFRRRVGRPGRALRGPRSVPSDADRTEIESKHTVLSR